MNTIKKNSKELFEKLQKEIAKSFGLKDKNYLIERIESTDYHGETISDGIGHETKKEYVKAMIDKIIYELNEDVEYLFIGVEDRLFDAKAVRDFMREQWHYNGSFKIEHLYFVDIDNSNNYSILDIK